MCEIEFWVGGLGLLTGRGGEKLYLKRGEVIFRVVVNAYPPKHIASGL
jgi:hypothetical protein